MGLRREIEEVFRRALEQDLARISRLAQPSHHAIPSTPPPGMYYDGQEPKVQTSAPRLILKPTDFVVKRMHLDVLAPNDMQKVVDRRKKRKDDQKPGPFNKAQNAHDRFHALHEELGWQAAPLLTRQVQLTEDGKGVNLHLVIRFAGVDYVLAERPEEDPEHMVTKDRWQLAAGAKGENVEIPQGFAIDGWPEVIELPELDGNRRVFVRADIAAP